VEIILSKPGGLELDGMSEYPFFAFIFYFWYPKCECKTTDKFNRSENFFWIRSENLSFDRLRNQIET
jgi:hypothetical protein